MISKNSESLKAKMKGSIGGIVGDKPRVKDSLFGEIASSPQPVAVFHEEKTQAVVAPEQVDQNEQLQRVTLVISKEQRNLIQNLAQDIQFNGTKKTKGDRVTPNTVLRCLINLLEDFDADISKIKDEDDLNRLMKTYFGPTTKK